MQSLQGALKITKYIKVAKFNLIYMLSIGTKVSFFIIPDTFAVFRNRYWTPGHICNNFQLIHQICAFCIPCNFCKESKYLFLRLMIYVHVIYCICYYCNKKPRTKRFECRTSKIQQIMVNSSDLYRLFTNAPAKIRALTVFLMNSFFLFASIFHQ